MDSVCKDRITLLDLIKENKNSSDPMLFLPHLSPQTIKASFILVQLELKTISVVLSMVLTCTNQGNTGRKRGGRTGVMKDDWSYIH